MHATRYLVDDSRLDVNDAEASETTLITSERNRRAIWGESPTALRWPPRRPTMLVVFINETFAIEPQVEPAGVVAQAQRRSVRAGSNLLDLAGAMVYRDLTTDERHGSDHRSVPGHVRDRPCLPRHSDAVVVDEYRRIETEVVTTIVETPGPAFARRRHRPDRSSIDRHDDLTCVRGTDRALDRRVKRCESTSDTTGNRL